MVRGGVSFELNRTWCKRCGICITFCPRKVFTADADDYPTATNPEACTQCGMCEMLCPDQAVGVKVVDSQEVLR